MEKEKLLDKINEVKNVLIGLSDYSLTAAAQENLLSALNDLVTVECVIREDYVCTETYA